VLVDRHRNFPFVVALGCMLGLVVVAVFGLGFAAGHRLDASILYGFAGVYDSSTASELNLIVSGADLLPYALIGLCCIGVALLRRRPWRALTVAILLIGTGATTQVLKHGLAERRFTDFLGPWGQIEAQSWPSGHATAAMTLALCAILVSPPAARAAVALVGGAYAIGVAYAALALTWHYPSDILGGFFVAGLWVSLAVAVLHRVEDVDPVPEPRSAWEPPVVLGGLAAVIAAAVLATKADTVVLYLQERRTTLAGALIIAALALALVVTITTATARGGRSVRSVPSR
jgi:membrane-associated phospholipid phosphatase